MVESIDRSVTAGAVPGANSRRSELRDLRLDNPRRPSATAGLLRALVRDRFAFLAAIYLVLLLVTAVAAPLLAPANPTTQDLLSRLRPPAWQADGSWSNPLGTDALGRDLLSRIMYGGRISLRIGFTVVLLAGVAGTAFGLAAGYFGGRLESAIMRLVDLQTAFPYFLLAVTLIAAVGRGERNLIIVLSLGSWVVYARFARAMMLSIRNLAYIEAARSLGCGSGRIVLRHALPNLASPVITLATLELSRVILAEAGFSFLGLGVQPPNPAWGLMVAEGHSYISSAWWLSAWPGLQIALAALSINVFATWLRAATDPIQRTRQLGGRASF